MIYFFLIQLLLFQLPPVGGRAIYTSKGGTRSELAGRLLYKMFQSSIVLEESMRQAGPENEAFRGQLERLAHGTFTRMDWESWREREYSILSIEEQKLFQTSSATKLCALKADMTEFNVEGLRATNNPLLMVKAKNLPASSSKYGPDKASGLSNCLPITKHCSVILTVNLWPDAKLVNGSRGTIRY